MAFSKVILDGETLMDVTQDTVAAGKLFKDITAHKNDGTLVTGTFDPSSTGDVIFLDYDGTVVDAKTKTEINAMTSDSDLPANPTHTGLTAQGWNWSVTQLKAQLTAMPDQKIYVGQMYVTTSGATEIDVEMLEGRLSPKLTICVNGSITVDWGDETTPDSVTGTSLSTRKEVSHTYSLAGNYTISISLISGHYCFYGSTTYTLLRKNTTSSENRVYASCIKKIRIGNGITNIKTYSFYNCYNLNEITIPSSVTNIADRTFYYCYNLKSVTIPSGLTSIGSSTFRECYSLKSINIPSSVTSIENNVFSLCFSLKQITIPSGVTSIGTEAFSSCANLEQITIPSGVTSIENSTFNCCHNLKSINIPSNVTSIKDNVFYYCYNLKSVTIQNGMTSIGNYAFYYCYSLKSITIPSSVTSIGNYAFAYCYSFNSITIQGNMTSIGNYAFYYCFSLKSITIPSSMTSIGYYAFAYCYSLKTITIPSGVTSIGDNAFISCYGVAKYHILPEDIPTIGTDVFKSIVTDCVIYVPQGKLSDYQNASNWSAYASYMQEEPAA